MSDPLPPRLRGRPRRPLTVPAARRPISADALRAAYAAHRTYEHHGHWHYRCRTCQRYTTALTDAVRSQPPEPPPPTATSTPPPTRP